MSPRLFLVIGVFILIVIVGGYASAQMSSNDLDPATYKDHNDLLKEIASRVPEFGGAYSSNNGTTLNIYLTENETSQEKQQNTQEALEDLLDVKRGLTLNVIKGTYTITQLSEWYETLRSDGIWNQNGVGQRMPQRRREISGSCRRPARSSPHPSPIPPTIIWPPILPDNPSL